MDLVPFDNFLHTAIETRRAFPEGVEVLRQFLETYVSDPLKDHKERRRTERVEKLAKEKIGNRKIEDNLEEILTSSEIDPLLEAIQDDDRKELQDIWANMLAKFATGQMNGFRRDYIDTLKNMDVFDVACFNFIIQNCNSNESTNETNIYLKITSGTNIDYDDISISIDKLISLRCLNHRSGNFMESSLQTSYGKKLYQACQPPK
ncbi:hypothetical protein GFGA_1d0843 [Gluconobacter frateurii NBRC 103465]|nr:hypothetical protein GFGA_1d0843 [Gluconobacter frateurii NBRC 103465]